MTWRWREVITGWQKPSLALSGTANSWVREAGVTILWGASLVYHPWNFYTMPWRDMNFTWRTMLAGWQVPTIGAAGATGTASMSQGGAVALTLAVSAGEPTAKASQGGQVICAALSVPDALPTARGAMRAACVGTVAVTVAQMASVGALGGGVVATISPDAAVTAVRRSYPSVIADAGVAARVDSTDQRPIAHPPTKGTRSRVRSVTIG